MIYFSSDHHFQHAKVIEHCKRPYSTQMEMDSNMIEKWNSVVKDKDEVYYLGDLTLGNWGTARSYLKQLRGRIKFIEGNHDKRWFSSLESNQKLPPIYELNYMNKTIVLSHYPLRSWNKSFHDSYHIFGHCLDEETEILTDSGWKNHILLGEEDLVCTMDLNTDKFEYNKIEEIIKYNYSGDTYSFTSKGLDINVTDEHVLIVKNRKNNLNKKILAKDIVKTKRRTFIKSGEMGRVGLNIREDILRLLVWIASDGSIYNTNLIRIRLEKKRKIDRLKNLLDRLGVEYRKIEKRDYTSFNFNFEMSEFGFSSLKPLPPELIECNRNQVAVVLDEYSHTDGKYYKDSLCIWTSKTEERDLLQSMCVTSGYQCNYETRVGHGFSKVPNYTLIITDKKVRDVVDISLGMNIERVYNKLYWCVRVKNQTIVIRRNGKPVVVGNCHGNMPPHGKSFDIGVDCWNFYPVSIEQVFEKMESL